MKPTILTADVDNLVIENCRVVNYVSITAEEAALNAEAWAHLERIAMFCEKTLPGPVESIRALIAKRRAIK